MFKGANLLRFFKAQLSAFTGGIVDYLIMIACTEFLGIHYTISIAIGGLIGAAVNFSINKYWSFETDRRREAIPSQLMRFAVMLIGSIALKAAGTFALTEYGKVDYKISRLLVDLAVSLGFNYTLQRFWVFRSK